MLVYRALHGIAPSYIARFCVKQPVVERRYELRSAAPSQHDLVVPATKTQFGVWKMLLHCHRSIDLELFARLRQRCRVVGYF